MNNSSWRALSMAPEEHIFLPPPPKKKIKKKIKNKNKGTTIVWFTNFGFFSFVVCFLFSNQPITLSASALRLISVTMDVIMASITKKNKPSSFSIEKRFAFFFVEILEIVDRTKKKTVPRINRSLPARLQRHSVKPY